MKSPKPILTKEVQDKRMARCIEYLKRRNKDVTHHFSPYSENDANDLGSDTHMFSTDSGEIFMFIFDENEEFTCYQTTK